MELIDLGLKDSHEFRERIAGPFPLYTYDHSFAMFEFHMRVFPLRWILDSTGKLNDILKTDGR